MRTDLKAGCWETEREMELKEKGGVGGWGNENGSQGIMKEYTEMEKEKHREGESL